MRAIPWEIERALELIAQKPIKALPVRTKIGLYRGDPEALDAAAEALEKAAGGRTRHTRRNSSGRFS